jgi:glycosyltransferase involved in cell wall biosynthesis
MPAPDRDAGSLRIVNLLMLLKELSCKVIFVADDLSSRRPSTHQLREAGIDVLSKPLANSIEEHLQQEGEVYDLVFLSRVNVASKYIHCVRQFAPQALVVFDTIDLHFLRGFRGAKVTGNLHLLRRALQAKKEELTVAQEADCTLVVSPVEKTILEKECPGIKVHIVSLIQPVYGSARPSSEREGIVFIGSFPHHPNVDAMTYFCNDVYPLLKEKIAGVKTTIIGSNPPAWLKKLRTEDFIVTDYVPDVAPYFSRCKLSIAPLRYGAGVKGKVLLSMSYGVPVVASSVAAEGIPVVAGRDILIGDNPDSFSDKVAELYHDESLWRKLSENGLTIVTEHFSFLAAREKLVELFDRLAVKPCE